MKTDKLVAQDCQSAITETHFKFLAAAEQIKLMQLFHEGRPQFPQIYPIWKLQNLLA